MKNLCPFLKEKHTEKNVENILLLMEYEFFLINILNYDFYVFCPYKAMLGFIYEIKTNQKKINLLILDDNNSREFENKCEALIDQTFLTDLIFIYSFSYIALSCIFITAETFKIKFDDLKFLLNLENIINYEVYINETLLSVRKELTEIKILNDEEFINKKKRILTFLNKNPKYVEKIEKDREGVKIRMKQFSDMFDDNLVNSQVLLTTNNTIIEKNNDKIMIDQKRERNDVNISKNI